MTQDLSFELAPTPRPDGSAKSVSERLSELNVARFISVRNLATMHYKKNDGTPLMEYKDTLVDRDKVRQRVVEFEVAQGWITADQPGDVVNTTTVAPVSAPQIGMPQMVSFSAPPPAPSMATPPSPPPLAAAPMGMPPPPPSDPAPSARGKRKAMGAPGTSVAPPPGLPPPVSLPPEMSAPTMTPVSIPPPPPVVAGFSPASFSPASFGPPAAAPMAATSGTTVDLGPVLQKIDQLGKGLEVSAGNSDQALKEVAALRKEMKYVLTMMHHLYVTVANNKAPGTLPEFLKFLDQYIPS